MSELGRWHSEESRLRSANSGRVNLINHRGERWRGKLSPGPKAHPLIKQLFTLMNEHQTTMVELGERVGLGRQTISGWRYNRTPNLRDIEAAFNALGYDLVTKALGC